jgi:hypothetical protein
MTIPVGGFDVNFYISGPALAVNLYGCIEKIGPGILVERPGMNYPDSLPVGSE